MSDVATSPSWLNRIRYTPMLDLLRGRFTGRLDFRQHIAQSGLPQPAGELIGRVTRRTHLRRSEKLDVANELISHFADGLESGKKTEQLIASFGNERQAARLIARAKRRNRSIFGRAQTIIVRGLMLVLAAYLLVAIYFFSGRPSSAPAFEKLNHFGLQFPESQRAWPIYDRVFGERSSFAGDKMEQIRQASTRPVIGFIANSTAAYQRFGNERDPHFGQERADEFSAVIDRVGDCVTSDMEEARKQSQPARWLSDFDTTINLCRQWHVDPAITSDELQDLFRQVTWEIIQVTWERSFLSDEQLHHVAVSIVPFHVAGDMVNPAADEMEFDDWLNRTYTARGLLPSRITPAGLENMDSIMDRLEIARDSIGAGPTHYLVEPIVFLFMPSRAAMVDRFEDSMKLGRSNLLVPHWKADRSAEKSSGILDQIDSRLPILFEIRQLGMAREKIRVDAHFAEHALFLRDGALIGIGMTIYHEQHNRYPASLNELYPTFVSEKIVDRITGEPLQYQLNKGLPLVYSVADDFYEGHLERDYYGHRGDPRLGIQGGNWGIYYVPAQ